MIEKYGKVIENALVRDYTTYKLQGTIKKVVYPETIEKLVELLKYLKEHDINYLVVGNGSNLVFVGDYDGVVIKLDSFDDLEISGNLVKVGAGYNLVKLAMKTAKEGLTGLEFASLIPATVGGAIYMNAGAYSKEMKDIIKEVQVLDNDFNVKTLDKKDLKFGYRHSVLKENNYICLSATFELDYGDSAEILRNIKERKQKRFDSQPLDFPSAGSVFRNPEGDYAGRLIEEANLKGKSINDAIISEKHANFIVNKGNASGKDVKDLVEHVKKEIKDKYGIELIVEQEFIE